MENNVVINNRKTRNGGVELLRCICMFGIVCLHVIAYSAIAPFGNHSAMLLIMIYLLGRYLNKNCVLQNIKLLILILAFVCCLPVLFCFSRLKDFSSPFCIIVSISLFEIFRRLPVSVVVTKISCFLSPSLLGILILHNAGSHNISGGLVHRYFENFSANLNGASFLLYAFIIFFIALAVDLLRRLIYFFFLKITKGGEK